jgi:hypothetical protein
LSHALASALSGECSRRSRDQLSVSDSELAVTPSRSLGSARARPRTCPRILPRPWLHASFCRLSQSPTSLGFTVMARCRRCARR